MFTMIEKNIWYICRCITNYLRAFYISSKKHDWNDRDKDSWVFSVIRAI